MAKIILLYPIFAIKSMRCNKANFFEAEYYNNNTGVFSPWHYNKHTISYLVMLLVYWILTIVLCVLGFAVSKVLFVVGAVFGVIALICLICFLFCKSQNKKFKLSEELYDYTKSVGEALNEYKRCMNYLQAKFTLPDVSNQSGYFAFANGLVEEFNDIKELGIYDIKYKEFTKMMNYTYSNYEGYVKVTLKSILENPNQYEVGSLIAADELKIDDIVNNYPELEELHNKLEKINKVYQTRVLYLYEEDQSLYHNLDILEKLKANAATNAFAVNREFADKGIFVDLYAKYDECLKQVNEQASKAYDEYSKSIKSKLSEVLSNLEIEVNEDTNAKLRLVFTTKNEYLDMVNDLTYQKDELERTIKENIDRIKLVLSRLDERVNIFRKSDTVAEVDFFETLLNTCDIDEINIRVTRIFQILKRLRQQAVDYNKMLENVKEIVKEEVFANEKLDIDTVPKRVQKYIDDHIDVRTFISDLNVQLQIDDIKKKLYNYPIYLYSVYVANDDLDQVMKSSVRGYKYDGVDKKKNNILHLCAANNAVKCFDYFYKRVENKVLDVNADGETPLDIAHRTSPALFEKLSEKTFHNEEYVIKYHDYQLQNILKTGTMAKILTAMVNFLYDTAMNATKEGRAGAQVLMNQLETFREVRSVYDEEGGDGVAKAFKIKVLNETYAGQVNIVKELSEPAIKAIKEIRKYEAYYDKNIIDCVEKEFIDAVAFLDVNRIANIEAVLKHVLATNKSSYITSLFKTEYAQNDLMLSTHMTYIERAMIGVYSCQSIIALTSKEIREDKLYEYVGILKKQYVETLMALYEEQPNKYAYRMLAEENQDFASSHDENDIYYKLLGITRDATLPEIKKAYKRQVLAHHKDRGGDSSKIALINDAYAKLLLEKEA